MRRFRHRILFTTVAVLLLNSAAVNASLVVNGDFETGDHSGWSWTPTSGVTDAVVSFDVFGSDGPSLAFQSNMTNAHFLDRSILSQGIFLGADTAYTVSWEQAMQNIGPDNIQNTGTIEFRVNGLLLSSWHQGVLNANSSTGLQESRIFTPTTDGVYDFSFSFQRTGNYGSSTVFMYVDNVIVADPTVPEPTTFVIWSLLGLVGAGVQWRRRRTVA